MIFKYVPKQIDYQLSQAFKCYFGASRLAQALDRELNSLVMKKGCRALSLIFETTCEEQYLWRDPREGATLK